MSDFKPCPVCQRLDWDLNDYDSQGDEAGVGILATCECGTQIPVALVNNRPTEDWLNAKLETARAQRDDMEASLKHWNDQLILMQERAVAAETRVAELEDEIYASLPSYYDAEDPAQTCSHGKSRLAKAEVRVRELEACLEWRPIETAPRNGKPILMSHPHSGVYTGRWGYRKQLDDHGWVHGAFYDPTHWMPLPSPLKEGP